MKAIVYIVLPFFLFFDACQENRSKVETEHSLIVKTLLKQKIFIPSSIKWVTVPFNDSFAIIYSIFPTFHFVNDTTCYIVKCENEKEKDSILLAVDNILVCKGIFHIINDSTLSITYKHYKGYGYSEIEDSAIENGLKRKGQKIDSVYEDTLKILNGGSVRLLYKGNVFEIANNLFNESIHRLNENER